MTVDTLTGTLSSGFSYSGDGSTQVKLCPGGVRAHILGCEMVPQCTLQSTFLRIRYKLRRATFLIEFVLSVGLKVSGSNPNPKPQSRTQALSGLWCQGMLTSGQARP